MYNRHIKVLELIGKKKWGKWDTSHNIPKEHVLRQNHIKEAGTQLLVKEFVGHSAACQRTRQLGLLKSLSWNTRPRSVT